MNKNNQKTFSRILLITGLFLLVIKAIDYLAGFNEVSSVISVVGIIFVIVSYMFSGVFSGKYNKN